MDESAADCGQRSILNCIASVSMSSWMCDEEESQERIRRSDTGQRQERNGKATHGQVRQILELNLDSKRIPGQPSATMSRLQLFVRRFERDIPCQELSSFLDGNQIRLMIVRITRTRIPRSAIPFPAIRILRCLRRNLGKILRRNLSEDP
jgi:hypothetical protein